MQEKNHIQILYWYDLWTYIKILIVRFRNSYNNNSFSIGSSYSFIPKNLTNDVHRNLILLINNIRNFA
jgi:hypothetical protein